MRIKSKGINHPTDIAKAQRDTALIPSKNPLLGDGGEKHLSVLAQRAYLKEKQDVRKSKNKTALKSRKKNKK